MVFVILPVGWRFVQAKNIEEKDLLVEIVEETAGGAGLPSAYDVATPSTGYTHSSISLGLATPSSGFTSPEPGFLSREISTASTKTRLAHASPTFSHPSPGFTSPCKDTVTSSAKFSIFGVEAAGATTGAASPPEAISSGAPSAGPGGAAAGAEARQIDLQAIIKEYLRTHKRGERSRTVQGPATHGVPIILSLKPIAAISVLKYEPMNNGRYPAISAEIDGKVIAKSASLKPRPAFGSVWYQHAFLSPARMAEVKDKAEEQRDNRRHWGQSPLAT